MIESRERARRRGRIAHNHRVRRCAFRGGAAFDAMLRGRAWIIERESSAPRLRRLALMVIAFGMMYGAVMGGFGGVSGERAWQVLFSALKMPLLLFATFALSLPSFLVVNTLLGLRDDFGRALHALAATQAGLTIILASLAPFTVLWYASFDDYNNAVLFNAVMLMIASIAAQWLLRRLYRPLIERDARHRLLMHGWLVIYAFVGIQMGWVLRPFIGKPGVPPRFFREEAWGNAYEVVFGMVVRALGG